MGVDHLGFAVGDQGVPAQVTFEKARELFSLVPDSQKTSALTVKTDLKDICTLEEKASPDILHICSDTYAVSTGEMEVIRRRISSDTALMKSINVTDKSAIGAAEEYEQVSDYLLLDTSTDDVPGIGASGETHDWSISRQIVANSDTPVILAGGLGPDNVEESIREVRPDGVDSYSKTSSSERKKDIEKTRQFFNNAKKAAGE
jgi:phosphoribosylanthranilate isomerase